MSTAAIDSSRTSERLSAFLSDIHTNNPVDNIFVDLPLMEKLYGARMKKAFGRQIMIPIDTAQNSTVKSFADTEAFATTVPDTARTLVYPGKNYGAVLAFTWEEMRETAGNDHKVFDLVEHRRKNILASVRDKLNYDLWAQSVGSKDINSVPLVVSTSRSLGGIDSSSNSYWDAQEATSVGAFSSNGISKMRSLYNDIMAVKKGRPDVILTTQSVFEAYENELDSDVRYERVDKLDRGAQELMFKATPVMFDDDCPSGHLYQLKMEHLKLVVDPDADMSFGEVQESQNSHVFAAKFVFRGQLISDNARCNGRLTGIS